MKLGKKISRELATAFNDPQVVSVAITKDDAVYMTVDFNRYGLYETGIYRMEESGSLEPVYIFKKSPRVWNRDICMKKLAKEFGATLIESAEEMDAFLSQELMKASA